MSFDPWGQRRQTDWQTPIALDQYTPSIGFETHRGFTDHEHLDTVGLIHMNGRVYDPILGRFLSADVIIQDYLNQQSFNRYTYVWNNPLSYRDPTGHLVGFIAAFVATAIAVHVYENGSASDRQAIATGACVIGALFGQPYACAAITTAHVYAETNDFKSALRAGITSAITTSLAIGASDAIGASSFSSFQSAAAHGTVGGALSHVQGGKFGHGFASSFITVGLKKPIFEKFSISSSGAYRFHRTATAATLGGLGAWASGGKPAFGAFVSALQHTYTYESSDQAQVEEAEAEYADGGIGLESRSRGKAIKGAYEAVKRLFGSKSATKSANPTQKQLDKFQKQRDKHGNISLERSQRKIQRRLNEHVEKLEQINKNGGHTSSVEREIRNFERELKAIDKVLGKGE